MPECNTPSCPTNRLREAITPQLLAQYCPNSLPIKLKFNKHTAAVEIKNSDAIKQTQQELIDLLNTYPSCTLAITLLQQLR